MKRFTLLMMVVCLLSGQANALNPFLTVETDTAEYVSPKDTTVYFPPIDTTHYEPVDTGEVVTPVMPNNPVIHVPTIREEDNVTEFSHNPVMETGQTDKQEFTMSIEGDYLRIKGTLMARGYDKHYIHCQIIGDSVHLQRFDMDPESTDMILHHVDIRIPGFTEDYYHVTLAEQNDVPLYKQYMMMPRAVMRANDYKTTTEFSTTGTTWYARHHYSQPLPARGESYIECIYIYRLGTDTIIGGKNWKKLQKERLYEGVEEKEIIDLGFIREEEGIVWFYPEGLDDYYPHDENVAVILYDFTLKEGDVIYWNYYNIGYTYEPVSKYGDNTLTVKSVYTVNGRKVIDFGHEKWIEGIGSNSSAFFDQWLMRPTNGSTSWEEPLQVIASNGTLVYFQGEILPVEEQNSWLKDGMSWHEYKAYGEDKEGFIREISLSKGEFQGRFHVTPSSPFVYLQECNKKVYGMMFDHKIILCYDFSLNEGDVITLPRTFFALNMSPAIYDECTVTKVDSVKIDGTLRKRIILTGDREDVWIEGIGSLNRVFPIDEYNSESTLYPVSHVTCCHDGETNLYLHPEYANCTTKRTTGIPSIGTEHLTIHSFASSILCTAHDAMKMEVYTMDAVKVGEARFTDGQAEVKVSNTPATYLYIVTYPDGRRESGKVIVKGEG